LDAPKRVTTAEKFVWIVVPTEIQYGCAELKSLIAIVPPRSAEWNLIVADAVAGETEHSPTLRVAGE